MVNTIKALWEHSCTLWIHRNEFIHGKDETTKWENLKRNLKWLWTRHSNMTKTMFQPSLEPYLQWEQTMSSNDEWK
jgi:hypothetical protein